MDSMKQTLVGILATIVIALGASWMSLNKRIDILEVQVQNDHDMLMQWDERHERGETNVSDIRMRIIQLQDLKVDKDDVEGAKK
jgi:uncharacterized protein YxeA